RGDKRECVVREYNLGLWDEVQKTVQAEDHEGQAEEVAGDCRDNARDRAGGGGGGGGVQGFGAHGWNGLDNQEQRTNTPGPDKAAARCPMMQNGIGAALAAGVDRKIVVEGTGVAHV